MKRRQHRRPLRLITEISVMPLLLLVLVLLLIALITIPLLKVGIPPLPASAGIGPPKEIVTLAVDAQQALKLDDAAVAKSDLPAALKKLRQTRPEAGVLVQMHRDLPVQSLVDLMDHLAKAGVARTSVVASPAGAP